MKHPARHTRSLPADLCPDPPGARKVLAVDAEARERERGRREAAETIMSVTTADGAWGHLYPPFRERLEAAFDWCSDSGLKMFLFEGYRSQARQTWLYASGRTRTGPIVTYLKTPLRHGGGTAADCYPVHHGKMVFAFTPAELATWRAAQAAHGLEPTRMAGDYGHTQLIADAATLAKARAWCAAGFPPEEDDDVKRIKTNINGHDQTQRVPSYLKDGGEAVGGLRALWDYFQWKTPPRYDPTTETIFLVTPQGEEQTNG